MHRLTKLKRKDRLAIAIVIPASCSWMFTIAGIFLFRDYGLTLFVIIPLFIGVSATILGGYGVEHTYKQVLSITAMSVLTYCAGLLIFALEGLICILMAAPLGIVIASVGTIIGEAIIKFKKGSPLTVLAGLALLVPLMMSFENLTKDEPGIYAVTTSVVIDAPKEKVWEKVVAFSKIDEPKELLFRAGVAYPTHAEIIGSGVGAIRYCNFSTGRFVEPITTWNAPDLLQFSVKEMPEPLKEISPYDIQPTHLHGYFVSTKGEFRLTTTADNKTLLEGTTWYYHKIAPATYWQLWTTHILHKIHNRVLQHIKKDAEQ
jgi:hypothetical protein